MGSQKLDMHGIGSRSQLTIPPVLASNASKTAPISILPLPPLFKIEKARISLAIDGFLVGENSIIHLATFQNQRFLHRFEFDVIRETLSLPDFQTRF